MHLSFGFARDRTPLNPQLLEASLSLCEFVVDDKCAVLQVRIRANVPCRRFESEQEKHKSARMAEWHGEGETLSAFSASA